MKPFPLFRPATLTLLFLALCTGAPAARADEGDDQYRFLAGLAEKGLHEMVVREGEDFLKRFSDHPKKDLARYRLATALYELKETERALPHLRALARFQRFEFAAEVAFRLGQCELAEGDPAAARKAFEACLAAGKDYLMEPARFHAAEAAFQEEDYAAADAGYAELSASSPSGTYARDASAGRAWCAWKLGRADEAAQRIERHLERYEAAGDDPYAGELRLLLGEARLRAGDAAGALSAYRGVKDAAHADAALRGTGFALAEQGDHAGAARAFGTLLERSPDGPFAAEAALFRGVHLFEAGDAAGALSALSHRAAGDGPEVLYWRARAQAQEGDARAALRTLERALAAGPDEELRARLELARGDALTALGRGAEAVAAYGASGSDYALHAAAVAALNAGDAEEAARLGDELLRRHPGSEYAERTRVAVGEAWFQRGDLAHAEQALAGLDTGAADPALRARAASRLAWCAYRRGDHAGAAQRFARLADESPAAPEAEEARAMEGRARDDAGDVEGAVRAWRAHLKQFPAGASRPAVLAGLARREELPAAQKCVETLQRESPDSELLPQALFDLAERASQAGQRDVAEATYRALLARASRAGADGAAPLAAPARYGLAWCLVQADRCAEAARELELLRADASAAPELRASGLELAVWAWRRAGEPRKSAEAWRAFAALCQDEQRLFEAAKTAALALKESGAPREASDLLHELLERVRTPAVAVLALVEGAYLALDAGDVDRAEAEVAVARRRAPDDPKLAEASFFVAEARFAAGAKEAALPLYRAGAAQGSPVAALALYKLGFAELDRGDLRAAETALERLAAEHQESEVAGEGLFLLAEARFRQGEFEAAAADLERLRREHPRHEVMPKALFRLGQAWAELGRWQECDAALTELLEKSPRFENLAEAELTRGRALVALGRGRAARQALARVLALDGESVLAARAHLELGRLARSEGDLEGALSEFLKVAVLYAAGEEVAEALFLAGECLAEQKKPDAARERWREAAEEHPDTKHGALARARLGEPAAGSR